MSGPNPADYPYGMPVDVTKPCVHGTPATERECKQCTRELEQMTKRKHKREVA